MRTVNLLLLGGLLLGPVACRPKLTIRETKPDTVAEVEPIRKLLLGKWTLLSGGGRRLPWLNQHADLVKGRTLEFRDKAQLLVTRGDEPAHETTYQLLDKDTLAIDLFKLLGTTAPPGTPLPADGKMRVKVTVAEDEMILTLTPWPGDKGPAPFDKYARAK